MTKNSDKDVLIAKVIADEELTREEERFYMIEVLGCTKKQVDNIFAINNNKDPNVIID